MAARMSITVEFGLATALVGSGWFMSAWAARYDYKSWIMDFVWRFVRRQGWRHASINAHEVRFGDDILRRQLSERAADINADAARIGRWRAAAKHGALFAAARIVGTISGPVMLIGLSLAAHALYRSLV
jgi:hypothetical protein